MVYNLAKKYGASDDKDTFEPERKIHKKRSRAAMMSEFVADNVDVVKKRTQQKHEENNQGKRHQQTDKWMCC